MSGRYDAVREDARRWCERLCMAGHDVLAERVMDLVERAHEATEHDIADAEWDRRHDDDRDR